MRWRHHACRPVPPGLGPIVAPCPAAPGLRDAKNERFPLAQVFPVNPPIAPPGFRSAGLHPAPFLPVRLRPPHPGPCRPSATQGRPLTHPPRAMPAQRHPGPQPPASPHGSLSRPLLHPRTHPGAHAHGPWAPSSFSTHAPTLAPIQGHPEGRRGPVHGHPAPPLGEVPSWATRFTRHAPVLARTHPCPQA
jgi:hypothetical protein